MFIAFRLKPGRDDDLIEWAESLGAGDQSYHIRETLRRNLNPKGGSNYALPPSPSPVIKSNENKSEVVPKKAASREFDIKNNEGSLDDLEKAFERFM
jgi:hypothetical protein